MSEHRSAYCGMGLCSEIKVVSSFGVLHDDFLRFLWVVAGQFDGELDVGARRAYDNPRPYIFFKLHACVALGAALASSMRFVGIPGTLHYVRLPRQFYKPSDPTFRDVTSLNGILLGAFPLGGDILCVV